MRFEAVIELHNEGMIQHSAYRFLVFYDILFLVVADEPLQHHLHRVELPIAETPHQVDLAETSNRQTLANLILFEPSIGDILKAVEGGFLGEDALSDRDLIV